MARQRFIWPTIWDDPDLGRLPDPAIILYIACFSNADDEGRLLGDPLYLRSIAFRYKDVTVDRILELRALLETACNSYRVYLFDGTTYIAFANWDEFQKPKYPRPSKLPPPPGYKRNGRKPAQRQAKSSGTRSEHVGEDSGKRSTMGWVGLGSTKSTNKEPAPIPEPVPNKDDSGQGSAGEISTVREEARRILATVKSQL